ncbi:FAD/NAD-binding domain-containing protein [Dentipellis sp. KUC8613]|nr:FAD/NAD-binding domain-containing protein [Dentipellis sp. KUC8613]
MPSVSHLDVDVTEPLSDALPGAAATAIPSAPNTNDNGKATTADSNGAANGLKNKDLGEHAIDEYRPMKVVCIGAGYSGIVAGIRFAQRIPNLDLTIYEKQDGVGGAWWANRYPGLACDIPSHCYQLTFEENTQWSAFYAPGPEILAYLEHVVAKYKLMRYIQLRTELVHAQWDESLSRWRLRLRRPRLVDGVPANGSSSTLQDQSPPSPVDEEFEEFEDTADVLFMGTGTLSRWAWPDIPGLETFGGKLVHSAQWDTAEGGWEDTVKGWEDKTVGVIGLGSSAIQIVPALQRRVRRVVQFVRGKTWIAAPFSVEKMSELTSRKPEAGNYTFSEEERDMFVKDPEYYRKFRHAIENDLNSVHGVSYRGSEMQKGAMVHFKNLMTQKLAKKPWIAEYLIPSFSVSCRRLTPGPGYLESLCEDNVTFEPTPITRITPTGIELQDGRTQPLDVLVCATGFDTSYRPPYPVIGRNGISLQTRWAEHAEAYLSLTVDGFPNMFFGLGPNAAVNSGSLLVLLERAVDYAVAATAKMQRERIASIDVKKAAVQDWSRYIDAYFQKTVYLDNCRSWYKNSAGRIIGLWPGSCLHAVRTLSSPRWEDFDYTLLDQDRDSPAGRFAFLGSGWTFNEKTMTGDRAWYLNDVDIPPAYLTGRVMGRFILASDNVPYRQRLSIRGSTVMDTGPGIAAIPVCRGCGGKRYATDRRDLGADIVPSRLGESESGAKPASANGTNGHGAEAFSAPIGDFAIDDYRRMKVVCIGAGYTGVVAGIRFAQRIPNLDLTIYEKEEEVGGTWWVNRYPYQLTFEPNTNWSSFYVPGPEILAYIKGIVEKYKLMKYIQLRTELIHAQWDESKSRWHLRLRRPRVPPNGMPNLGTNVHSTRPSNGTPQEGEFEEFEDTADVLFMGTGPLNRWSWPDIPGLRSFEGKLLHSGNWDRAEGGWEETVKDWGDKTVGVIGLGSSSIQLVPSLQPRVKQVVQFARGKTWIAAPFAIQKLSELMSRDVNSQDFTFSEAEREAFAKDPELYNRFKHEVEHDMNSVFSISLRGSEMQALAASVFKENMRQKLAKKPWIAESMIPSFAVCCRRITPGPGYLEALCEDNVTFETTHIDHVTPTGITLKDGRTQPLDVLVCATGFDTSYDQRFPIIGRNGISLSKRWASHAEAYLSLAVDGFPNMFLGLGPNAGVNSGSLIVMLEKVVDYVVAATAKMQRERIASMEAKSAATRDWARYVEDFFPKNDDGRVIVLWPARPGSCLHSVRALSNPRWEDFDYTPLDRGSLAGRFAWLGNGQTVNELTMTGDRAWYLNDIDIPPVPTD